MMTIETASGTGNSVILRRLRSGISLAVVAAFSAALIPSAAGAQPAQQPPQSPADPAEDAAATTTPAEDQAATATQDADIVITGSLIQRPNNVSVSPIVTVSADALKQSGAVDLEATLNQLPGFTPAGGAGTGGQGGGGRASVNLHGLGSNRNLVLLDGKRLPLSDINGNVDINILPESIIGGIDVITGGASAIYGSDAMSGVVNFKTVAPFDGIRGDVQIGNSERGDYRKFNASLAFGARFAEDRGHVVLAASYTNRQGLVGKERPFFDLVTPSSFIGTGTYVPDALNLPTQAAINGIFTRYGVTSTVSRTINLGFNDNGTLFTQTGALNYQGPTIGGYRIIAGNVRMPVGQQIQTLNPLERKSLFGKLDYDVTDHVTAYGQFLYVDSTVNTASGGSLTQIGALTTIPVTNPFIPADLRTILASRPNPNAPFLWNGRYVGIADKNWDETYTVSQFAGGLKGDIFNRWKWDVYASYDKSIHDQALHNAVLKSQVQSLLNAADGGNSLCAGGFNPFGIVHSTNISPTCISYMTKTALSKERLTQTQVQGLVNGPLFDLPAGPVQLALLASYRRNTYNFVADRDLKPGSFTRTSSNIEAVAASQDARGRIGVKEFAAQIDIPILNDTPFFRELAVGGAIRYSDYTTSGGVTSYEGDVRWRPIQALLFRGSYQRAVRAPNIGELFSPTTGTQVAFGTPPAGIGDPCDVRSTARTGPGGAQVRALCLAQGVPAPVIDTYTFPTTATGGTISGNRALTPERATTYNAGFILNPHLASPLLRDLSLSVDYYNIKIKNVISSVPGLTALSKCYNLDGTNPSYSATNSFCQLLTRDAQGQLTDIALPFLNLGGLNTDGVEVQFNWGVRLSDIGLGQGNGKVYVNSAIGWMRHFQVQTLPGTPFQDFIGTSTIEVPGSTTGPHPRWKALTTFGYRSDRGGFGLRWRYQGPMNDITAVTTPATPAIGVKAYELFDLFGSVRVNEGFEIRGGVTNLFDRGLPIVASSQTSTDAGTYDVVGRSYYVGVRVEF
jgi:iron complex outermembrane receptor protein